MAREIIEIPDSPPTSSSNVAIRKVNFRKEVATPRTPLGPKKRFNPTPVKKVQDEVVKVEVKVKAEEAQLESSIFSLSITSPTQSPSGLIDRTTKSSNPTITPRSKSIEYITLSDSDVSAPASPVISPPPRSTTAITSRNKPSNLPYTPRRRIRDPDSESEDEQEAQPSPPSPPNRPKPTHNRLAPPSPPRAVRQTSRQRLTRAEIRKYLDLYANAGGAEDDESDDDAGISGRAKHYDESLGSLKDFIVPDDYESSEASGSESDGEEGDEVEEDDIAAHSDGNDSDIIPLEDGSDGVDGILHFSPPPRLTSLPDLPDLRLLSIVDTDEDNSDEEAVPDSPKKGKKSGKEVSTTKPESKTKAKTPSKKAWASDRQRIAQDIFDELDRRVFERKLGSTGAGATLEWNNRLLTTAGTAHSRWTRHTDGTKTETVRIVLSEKVLTGEEQILSTVAHEMCHLASWIISGERKNPHGKIFKSWGRKVMRARPDIEVTTRHDYQIEYKYSWKCTGERCDKIYKRHSKSIDTSKQACGRCRSKLEPMFETRETAFQVYLRENMTLAKTAMPGAPHRDVMRALSKRWTEAKGEGKHAEFWQAMAVAAEA